MHDFRFPIFAGQPYGMEAPESEMIFIFTGRQRSCKPCTSYDRDVRLSVCPSVRPSVTR